jgi:hypothetical protein
MQFDTMRQQANPANIKGTHLTAPRSVRFTTQITVEFPYGAEKSVFLTRLFKYNVRETFRYDIAVFSVAVM